MPRSVRVYISHAASAFDRELRMRLEVHLAPLRRSGRIVIQHRDSVDYGEEQEAALRRLVAAADIFIPLLSPDYLADDIAHDIELAEALKRRGSKTLSIWPVRAAHVQVASEDTAAPLVGLVGFPKRDVDPLSALDANNRDLVLSTVTAALMSRIKSVEDSNSDARSMKKDRTFLQKSASELGPIEHRFALVIGINDFANADPLRYCAADAQSLYAKLTALGYVGNSLYDQHPKGARFLPSRQNIESELALLCQSAGSADLLFVHIGTHGCITADGKAVILTQDSRIEDLERTAIPVSVIESMLQDSRARRTVLSLDACHAGMQTATGRAAGQPAQTASDFYHQVYDRAEGYALIAACTAAQVAYEDPESGHGAYTRFLLESLDGNVALPGGPPLRSKGFVSLDDVRKYVLFQMRAWCVKQGRQPQDPNVDGRLLGDLILADYRAAVASAAHGPA